jgi:hypothetical protein
MVCITISDGSTPSRRSISNRKNLAAFSAMVPLGFLDWWIFGLTVLLLGVPGFLLA